MPATPDQLLDRIAATLREQVGPNVGEPFAKTQAFMAAVILGKLAGQLRAADADEVAEATQRQELVDALRGDAASTARVGESITTLEHDGGDAAWNQVVAALYADRVDLGPEAFDRALGLVRGALRARLDRTLAYSA